MRALLRLPQSAPGLRPLTLTASPAMVPVLGAPLIEPLLVRLARTGVDRITLLHECFSREVSDYFRDGRRLGALISHISCDPGASVEEQFAAAADGSGDSQPVLYFESPGWANADAASLLNETADGVRLCGSPGSRMAVLSPPGNEAIRWDDASALPQSVDWRPVLHLEQWWGLSMAALKGEAKGVAPPTPEPAPGVHTLSPSSNWSQGDITGPVWIGSDSRIEPGAIIEGPSWIGAGCRIGPNVHLKRCVVEDHTRLTERFELTDRYVVRNRAFGADGSTLILGDALADRSGLENDSAGSDLVRLATRLAGLRSPVFR